MTTRQVIENYYNAIDAGNMDEAYSYMSPGLRYWISGEGSWPLGGWYNGAESTSKMMSGLSERFLAGFKLTINSIVVEGERASVLLETNGIRTDGKKYHNQVHFAIVVQDGKIVEQQEFLDTIVAKDLFCGPMLEN